MEVTFAAPPEHAQALIDFYTKELEKIVARQSSEVARLPPAAISRRLYERFDAETAHLRAKLALLHKTFSRPIILLDEQEIPERYWSAIQLGQIREFSIGFSVGGAPEFDLPVAKAPELGKGGT